MQKKIYSWLSQYQNDRIPIPALPDPKPFSPYSFLGRLVLHLLRMSKTAVFIPALGAWYEMPSGEQAVGERTFAAINSAIGPQGLAAVDRILCFSAAKECATLIGEMRKSVDAFTEGFEAVEAALTPTSALPTDALSRTYEAMLNRLPTLFEVMGRRFHTIGRTQVLRRFIGGELRAHCKQHAHTLYNALRATNDGLVDDLVRHYANPAENPMPLRIVPEVAPFMDLAGIADAQTKVYVASKPVGPLSFLVAALYINMSTYFVYDNAHSCLVPVAIVKNRGKDIKEIVDATSLCYGVVALLRQFHNEHTTTFLALVSQYCRVLLLHFVQAQRTAMDKAKRESDAPPTVPRAAVVVRLLEITAEAAGIPIHELSRAIPDVLLLETGPL